ncbi:hypothetical protein Ccrd_013361, partial [Cynara cardunculus var. scolymus]
MDSKKPPSFTLILLLISSILFLQSRADGTGSVYFLDSSTHYYFRSRLSESKSMSLPELNEVLVANPFDRPHAVFLLEINGFGDKLSGHGSDSDVFSRALKSDVAIGDAEIQLSDEDELSLVSLNEPVPSDMEFTDSDLTNFALWLGGSYDNTASEPLNGQLTVPLANDVQLKLHMSKEADREYTRSIISLIHNVERAVQLHEDLSQSMLTLSELIKGRFDGLKAFQEHYGTSDIVQKGAELLVKSVSKIYESLQTAYKGQIVGVIVFDGSPAEESDLMLTVKFTTRPSPRWLEEEKGSHADAIRIAEVLLVRRTLAWITGIILIVATLMGICFLMNMPLTRDTLLYSNAAGEVRIRTRGITVILALFTWLPS